MKKRTIVYLFIKKMERLAKQKGYCIQFPHFGARYPDACCVDGFLWDLDSGDSDGLTNGGSDPCPVCNTRNYVKDFIDNKEPFDSIEAHIKYIFNRY